MTQLELPVETKRKWGGQRDGAGRPETGRRIELRHRARPYHDRHHPVHVTWRFVGDLPSLRTPELAASIAETIRVSSRREERRRSSFGVVHYSIQPNHLHLIVEAGSKTTLTRGLRGLASRIARRINRLTGRSGRVIADRYHAHELEKPGEVRNGIVYVLQNHLHHHPSPRIVDPHSSAAWFDGWAARLPARDPPSPVRAPHTWLLATGWRRHGAIRLTERPRS